MDYLSSCTWAWICSSAPVEAAPTLSFCGIFLWFLICVLLHISHDQSNKWSWIYNWTARYNWILSSRWNIFIVAPVEWLSQLHSRRIHFRGTFDWKCMLSYFAFIRDGRFRSEQNWLETNQSIVNSLFPRNLPKNCEDVTLILMYWVNHF